MNLLLLHPDDFSTATEVTISDRRFEHLKKIIRAEQGQTIAVGALNGKCGTGKITHIDKRSATLTVTLERNPPSPSNITLLLALPRPLMLKRILQTVTAMGIKDIYLFNSQRVEKSYWHSSDLDKAVLQHQLVLGLEQSGDTVLPNIYFQKNFKNFIVQDLGNIIHNKQALLADIGDYPSCPANLSTATVLAVGPEGGFIDDEVHAFCSAGFQAVQLGPRPLRVEAAVTALLGRLLAL